MRIIHLTDLHIGKAGEDTRGVDVRANFQTLLASIRPLKPDHIIITGDLCYREGNLDIYRWIKLQLDHNKIPYDVIAGNHDDSALLAVAFEQTAFLQEGTLFFFARLARAAAAIFRYCHGRAFAHTANLASSPASRISAFDFSLDASSAVACRCALYGYALSIAQLGSGAGDFIGASGPYSCVLRALSCGKNDSTKRATCAYHAVHIFPTRSISLGFFGGPPSPWLSHRRCSQRNGTAYRSVFK